MSRAGVLFFLFLLFHTFAVSQQSVQWKVIDLKTGESLPAATVICNDSLFLITDFNGNFFLTDSAREKKYTLQISYMGYHDLDTVVSSRGESYVLSLKPATILASGAEITANRIMSSDKSKPRRIIHMDSRALETIPSKDVQGLFTSIPGVVMENDLGIYDTQATVMLHGLGGGEQGRTLVMRDGVPLNKADGGTVSWNSLSKEMFSELRVIKGPSSALYGANAMGGVIDLISSPPKESFTGRATIEAGTYQTLGGSLYAAQKRSVNQRKLWWKAFSKFRTSKGYLTTPEAYLEYGEDTLVVPSGLRQISAQVQGGMEQSHGALTFMLSVMDDLHGNGWQVYEEEGSFSHHTYYSGQLATTHRIGKLEMSGSLYLNFEHYNRQNEYLTDGEYKLYDVFSPRMDIGGKLAFTSHWFLNHLLQWGIDFRHGSVNASDVYYTSTDIIYNYGKSYVGGLYFTDEWQIIPYRFSVSAGVRGTVAGFWKGGYTIEMPSYHIRYLLHYADADISDYQWNALTPSLALNYRSVTGRSRIYLSWGEGFRPPVLGDMCRASNENYLFRIPNPALKPEVITNLELGGDRVLFANTNISFSLYTMSGRNFLYSVATGDSVDQGFRIIPVARMENIGRVRVNGAELTLEQQIGKQWVGMGYVNWSQGIISDYSPMYVTTVYDLAGKFLTGIPEWQAGTTVLWYGKRLNAGLTWKFTGKRWINETNSMDQQYLLSTHYPAYQTLDLRLSWSLKKWECSVDLQNALNHVHINRKGLLSPGRFLLLSLCRSL